MHNGNTLSASKEPPGRIGAKTSSHARPSTIKPTRLPTANQRVRKALDVVIAKVRDQDASIGEDLDNSLGKGGVIFFRPPPEWGL